MAKKQTLKAELRARTGSGVLKQMRREGWLPTVIYGKGIEPKNLKVNAKEFAALLAHSTSENVLVNLEIAGEGNQLAFLKIVQHEPLSGEAVHADFIALDEKSEITAHIPLELRGEPDGVKNGGGVLDQTLHSLDVKCKAADLPEVITHDVSAMGLGSSLHISEITLPAGVTSVLAGDVVVAHIGQSAAAVSEGITA